MLKPYLQLLLAKSALTRSEAESAMTIILEEAEPHQTAAFLSLLKYRGETAEEVAGMVEALQKKSVSVKFPFPTLDIVGTGGDMAHTVNISTGSAVLAAACGIPIAKHGNRSASGRSGSADVLEAFNIDIQASPCQLSRILEETGIAFLFAPQYHPSLKKVAPIRKGLGFPTVFNILGPLLHPAKAEYALIGVAHESLMPLMGQVILQLGYTRRTLLFHGCGLDELTSLGKMAAYDIKEGRIDRLELDPVSLGFSPCSLADLQGGSPHLNASLLRKAFAGEPGAIADALIFNAGAALWIFGQAPNLTEGIHMARQVQKAGKALEVLNKWESVSKQFKEGGPYEAIQSSR